MHRLASPGVDSSSAPVEEGHGSRAGRRGAAWTLIVLTPLIAELSFGSTPIRWGYLVLLWIPVYGSGVLLIRELVRRAGRGWPSILLLGFGYGLLEDGVGLQALTSPNLYGAADWGLRVAGVNLAYWEATAIYHVVFSAAVPIALTELIFARHGRRPYLRSGGLVLAAVVTVLGVLVLRFTVPIAQDAGYQAPLPFLIGAVTAVILLGLVALRVLPRWHPSPTDRPVGPVGGWAVAAFLATAGYLVLSHPMFGATQPAFAHGDLVAVPMVAVVVLAAGCLIVLSVAGRSSRWTDRHRLAVIGGALVGHTVAGIPITAFVERTVVDRVGLGLIAVITVIGLVLFDRRLRKP